MQLHEHTNGTRTIEATRQGLADTSRLESLLTLSRNVLLTELAFVRRELTALEGNYKLKSSNSDLLLGRLQLLRTDKALSDADEARLDRLFDVGLPVLGTLETNLIGLLPMLSVLGLDLTFADVDLETVLDGLDRTEGLEALLEGLEAGVFAEFGLLRDGLAELDGGLNLPESQSGPLLLDQLELLLPGSSLTDQQKTQLGQLLWNELTGLKALSTALLNSLPLLRSLGLGLSNTKAFSCFL